MPFGAVQTYLAHMGEYPPRGGGWIQQQNGSPIKDFPKSGQQLTQRVNQSSKISIICGLLNQPK